MKTFFIALILGIFIGASITAYYNSPESFESLFSSKSNSEGSHEQTDRGELLEKGKELVDSAKDAGIKTAIAGKFKVDSSIDASRIKIAVENGSVTLSGEISSRAEERKARDIALDTRYVKDVRSELEIAP